MIQITQTCAKHIHRISFREHGKTISRALFFFLLLLSTAVLADELYLKNGLLYRNVRVMDTTGTTVSFVWDSIRVSISLGLIEKIEMREYIPKQKSTHEIYSQSKYDEITQSQMQNAVPQKEGVQLTITTRGGEQHTGTILYATDSLLVLWQSTDPYNGRNLKSSGKVVLFSEIERIVIKREGRFWSGLGYGALIGGGLGAGIGFALGDDKEEGLIHFTAGTKALILGIVLGVPTTLVGGISGAIQGIDDDFLVSGNAETYKAIVPELKKDAIFSSLLPLELQTFVKQRSEEVSQIFLEQTSQTSTALYDPSPRKFHVSLGGGWMKSRTNNDIIDAFNASGFGGTVGGWFGPTDYPVDHSSPFTWNLGADYNLTNQFRLGLVRKKISEQEIRGKDFEVEYARATSINFFADYIIFPIDPLLLSRFEFAIGAGVSYNWLSVDGRVSSIFGFAYGENPNVFAVNKEVVGVNLRGSLDYYLSRNFSLQCKLEGGFMPVIDVPSVTHVNPHDSTVKTLKGYSVDFSGLDFSIGLRFHL